MVTAVDTSVLLDVLLNDPQHAPASIAALHRAAAEGSLAICDAALAEIVPVLTAEDLPQFLADWKLTFFAASGVSRIISELPPPPWGATRQSVPPPPPAGVPRRGSLLL